MDRRYLRSARPFGISLDQWATVGGGIAADGNVVGKPSELDHAELILALCDRFKKLPSEIYAEDVEILRLLKIVRRGSGEEVPG